MRAVNLVAEGGRANLQRLFGLARIGAPYGLCPYLFFSENLSESLTFHSCLLFNNCLCTCLRSIVSIRQCFHLITFSPTNLILTFTLAFRRLVNPGSHPPTTLLPRINLKLYIYISVKHKKYLRYAPCHRDGPLSISYSHLRTFVPLTPTKTFSPRFLVFRNILGTSCGPYTSGTLSFFPLSTFDLKVFAER